MHHGMCSLTCGSSAGSWLRLRWPECLLQIRSDSRRCDHESGWVYQSLCSQCKLCTHIYTTLTHWPEIKQYKQTQTFPQDFRDVFIPSGCARVSSNHHTSIKLHRHDGGLKYTKIKLINAHIFSLNRIIWVKWPQRVDSFGAQMANCEMCHIWRWTESYN